MTQPQTQSCFEYLSPLILPVLPETAGHTLFSMNLENTLADVAIDRGDAVLECHIEHFQNGKQIAEEKYSVPVAGGVPETLYIDRRFSGTGLGYAQISITADRPLFRKILTQHVYSFIERPDGGTFILNASYKFSDPLIIDLMRRVGRFCLVHPAHYVDPSMNAGNSTLIVNPFDGPIVARLATAGGQAMRRRIPPMSAELLPLDDLIDAGRWTCVLYTGNNRYPAWDVRHAHDDPNRINRIDHLEFFRGDLTVRRLAPATFVRAKARSAMRALGLCN